jgi:hypothetical protein
MLMQDEVANFWSRVNRSNENECWLWTGGTKGMAPRLYGAYYFRGRNQMAHRVSWILTHGEIPKLLDSDHRGTCVLHKCDTPLCVNPAHLFLGTHLDNMRDKVAKKRDPSQKPFCKRGHPRTPENLYTCKQGLRSCRECHKLKERKRRLYGNKEQRTS